jgi:hypothetical protein
MKTFAVMLVLLTGVPAFAWPHMSAPADAEDSPRAAGAELEVVSEVDRLKLEVIQLEEAVETLQHNLLAAQQTAGQCQANLIQCSAPQLEQHEHEAAASRAQRKAAIIDAYHLSPNDQVYQDGTIVRRPEKK